jgi:ABC-type multidrug transport system fused ATPase/permease subunit
VLRGNASSKKLNTFSSTNQSSSYLGILRRLAPFAKPYTWLIVLSLLLTVIGAGLAQVTPIMMQLLVNHVTSLVTAHASLSVGWPILVLVSLSLLFKEVFALCINIGDNYIGERLKVQIGAKLSDAAFNHLLSLDMAFFDKQDNEVGRITKRVDRGVESLSKVIKNLFVDILPLLANAAIALIIMYSVSVWIGITSTLVVPVYFFLSLKQAQKQKGVRTSIQDTQEQRTAGMFNVLAAIKLVKSFTRENFEASNHNTINQNLAKIEIQHHQVNHLFDGFKLFANQIGAMLVIIVTAILVVQGQMTIGAILLHLLLYNNITAPIQMLHRIYDETNEALAYAEGFFAIFDAKSNLAESTNVRPKIPSPIQGDIEFCNVSFSYVQDQEIIHNVNLAIPANKTVALVGLSGAGKTTIANLIGRFYDADRGEIKIDGIHLQDYPLSSIRNAVGFVLQQTHIFPGSIRENIRYGNLSATDQEVIEAAKKAGLHEEVIALKKGYDNPANKLSGGQMQRIAIARVFLKNPPILILDEPTASLDAIAAERIKTALDALRSKRTVLIISHNLASIIDADIINVLKEGKIIATGTHHTLYRHDEHYRSIIDANIENMNLEKLISVRNNLFLEEKNA